MKMVRISTINFVTIFSALNVLIECSGHVSGSGDSPLDREFNSLYLGDHETPSGEKRKTLTSAPFDEGEAPQKNSPTSDGTGEDQEGNFEQAGHGWVAYYENAGDKSHASATENRQASKTGGLFHKLPDDDILTVGREGFLGGEMLSEGQEKVNGTIELSPQLKLPGTNGLQEKVNISDVDTETPDQNMKVMIKDRQTENDVRDVFPRSRKSTEHIFKNTHVQEETYIIRHSLQKVAVPTAKQNRNVVITKPTTVSHKDNKDQNSEGKGAFNETKPSLNTSLLKMTDRELDYEKKSKMYSLGTSEKDSKIKKSARGVDLVTSEKNGKRLLLNDVPEFFNKSVGKHERKNMKADLKDDAGNPSQDSISDLKDHANLTTISYNHVNSTLLSTALTGVREQKEDERRSSTGEDTKHRRLRRDVSESPLRSQAGIDGSEEKKHDQASRHDIVSNDLNQAMGKAFMSWLRHPKRDNTVQILINLADKLKRQDETFGKTARKIKGVRKHKPEGLKRGPSDAGKPSKAGPNEGKRAHSKIQSQMRRRQKRRRFYRRKHWRDRHTNGTTSKNKNKNQKKHDSRSAELTTGQKTFKTKRPGLKVHTNGRPTDNGKVHRQRDSHAENSSLGKKMVRANIRSHKKQRHMNKAASHSKGMGRKRMVNKRGQKHNTSQKDRKKLELRKKKWLKWQKKDLELWNKTRRRGTRAKGQKGHSMKNGSTRGGRLSKGNKKSTVGTSFENNGQNGRYSSGNWSNRRRKDRRRDMKRRRNSRRRLKNKQESSNKTKGKEESAGNDKKGVQRKYGARKKYTDSAEGVRRRAHGRNTRDIKGGYRLREVLAEEPSFASKASRRKPDYSSHVEKTISSKNHDYADVIEKDLVNRSIPLNLVNMTETAAVETSRKSAVLGNDQATKGATEARQLRSKRELPEAIYGNDRSTTDLEDDKDINDVDELEDLLDVTGLEKLYNLKKNSFDSQEEKTGNEKTENTLESKGTGESNRKAALAIDIRTGTQQSSTVDQKTFNLQETSEQFKTGKSGNNADTSKGDEMSLDGKSAVGSGLKNSVIHSPPSFNATSKYEDGKTLGNGSEEGALALHEQSGNGSGFFEDDDLDMLSGDSEETFEHKVDEGGEIIAGEDESNPNESSEESKASGDYFEDIDAGEDKPEPVAEDPGKKTSLITHEENAESEELSGEDPDSDENIERGSAIADDVYLKELNQEDKANANKDSEEGEKKGLRERSRRDVSGLVSKKKRSATNTSTEIVDSLPQYPRSLQNIHLSEGKNNKPILKDGKIKSSLDRKLKRRRPNKNWALIAASKKITDTKGGQLHAVKDRNVSRLPEVPDSIGEVQLKHPVNPKPVRNHGRIQRKNRRKIFRSVKPAKDTDKRTDEHGLLIGKDSNAYQAQGRTIPQENGKGSGKLKAVEDENEKASAKFVLGKTGGKKSSARKVEIEDKSRSKLTKRVMELVSIRKAQSGKSKEGQDNIAHPVKKIQHG